MPPTSNTLQAETVRANGAIIQYRGVGYDSAQADAQGQKILGVSQRPAADGELVAVATVGTAVVEAGDAVARGDSLIVDADGRAIPATGPLALVDGATAVTSSAANGEILEGADLPEFVFADALGDADAAGDLIEVKLR